MRSFLHPPICKWTTSIAPFPLLHFSCRHSITTNDDVWRLHICLVCHHLCVTQSSLRWLTATWAPVVDVHHSSWLFLLLHPFFNSYIHLFRCRCTHLVWHILYIISSNINYKSMEYLRDSISSNNSNGKHSNSNNSTSSFPHVYSESTTGLVYVSST